MSHNTDKDKMTQKSVKSESFHFVSVVTHYGLNDLNESQSPEVFCAGINIDVQYRSSRRRIRITS